MTVSILYGDHSHGLLFMVLQLMHCDAKYVLFYEALKAGINKLNKYYKKLDNLDVYILSLCMYYMLILALHGTPG